jgi:hypothetical protein
MIGSGRPSVYRWTITFIALSRVASLNRSAGDLYNLHKRCRQGDAVFDDYIECIANASRHKGHLFRWIRQQSDPWAQSAPWTPKAKAMVIQSAQDVAKWGLDPYLEGKRTWSQAYWYRYGMHVENEDIRYRLIVDPVEVVKDHLFWNLRGGRWSDRYRRWSQQHRQWLRAPIEEQKEKKKVSQAEEEEEEEEEEEDQSEQEALESEEEEEETLESEDGLSDHELNERRARRHVLDQALEVDVKHVLRRMARTVLTHKSGCNLMRSKCMPIFALAQYVQRHPALRHKFEVMGYNSISVWLKTKPSVFRLMRDLYVGLAENQISVGVAWEEQEEEEEEEEEEQEQKKKVSACGSAAFKDAACCPVCKKIFDSKSSLGQHLRDKGDMIHKEWRKNAKVLHESCPVVAEKKRTSMPLPTPQLKPPPRVTQPQPIQPPLQLQPAPRPPPSLQRLIVDNAHVGSILGKGGCNIARVRATSGAHVKIQEAAPGNTVR